MGRTESEARQRRTVVRDRTLRDLRRKSPRRRVVDGVLGDLEEMRRRAGPFESRLHILGNHPPEALWPALLAADVVVMPSLWENFSLGALEVLALGRPLVATSGSGYDDFITSGENGMLVPPREPGPLADALGGLLSDAALRERLSRGATERIEDYDIPPVTARHVEFFEQVAAGTVPQTLSEAI